MMRPSHLFRHWQNIRRRAGRATHLALFTDFDGTLVPIERRPEKVKIQPSTRRLLRSIAHNGTSVGVISGRLLADIRRRVGLRGIWYAGAHGAFMQDPAGKRISRVTRKRRDEIARVSAWLQPRLAGVRGVWVEDKKASVAVHYRGAPRRSVELAELLLAGALSAHPGLSLMAGKKVWEILPDERTHKWAAVQWILRRESRGRPRSWLTFYVGDDVTDERVFQRLKGISVVVGKNRATHARFFLKNPREVAQLLERWSELKP